MSFSPNRDSCKDAAGNGMGVTNVDFLHDVSQSSETSLSDSGRLSSCVSHYSQSPRAEGSWLFLRAEE